MDMTSNRSHRQLLVTNCWHLRPPFVFLLFLVSFISCNAPTNTTMNEENPLLCDTDSGACALPGTKVASASHSSTAPSTSTTQRVKIVYFTDPICSTCWGIEPQLRKFKLEYGHLVDIEYRMGGLLPDWSYNSGGISKPSDVAHHWDEVSGHYDMPIDGDVWLEDPLDSSYPPSIACKAAEMQDAKKALLFLRAIREMVFLQKKNITKWEHLADAAAQVGLDVAQLKADYEGTAKARFEADLNLGRQLGVRGFPTLFFENASGTKEMVYGAKPYSFFEVALLKLYPEAQKATYDPSLESLLLHFNSLTAREFAELSNTPRNQCEALLNTAISQNNLDRHDTKNGAIWSVKPVVD